MEIILSSNCESLTGSLGRGFGYSIQRRKNGFFAKRNAKGTVPPHGHWNFIVACAVIAKSHKHIDDIKVSQNEVRAALLEAGHHTAMSHLKLSVYNARDIINLKHIFSL